MSAPVPFRLLARVHHAQPPEKQLQEYTVVADTFFAARAALARELRIGPECIRLVGQGEPPEHGYSPSELDERFRSVVTPQLD